jgi:hypothetical protein
MSWTLTFLVDSKEDFNAFMDAFLSFVEMLLPVVLPALTHFVNFIFTCSEFPSRWKCAVVLPIPKVSSPAGFLIFVPRGILMRRRLCSAHICLTGRSLMVNILRSGALNMVFRRVLYLASFCLFHLLMMFLV